MGEGGKMKPYIAKDTKQPLVVFGVYRVAEDGSIMRETVKREPLQVATDEDRELLEKHGIKGLKQMGFFGVIDRLSRGPGKARK